MRSTVQIPLAAANTPELIDRAIEERLAPGLDANRWRPDFAEFHEKRLWEERHQKTMMRKLGAALGDLRRYRILDLGCGRGGLAIALARAGCRVVAMDLRQRNLETTILRGRRHQLNPTVTAAAGERLPFADSSFDLVICKDMLEHCQQPESILAELARVLAPGGACYLTVVNRFGFKDPHYHLWWVNLLPSALADRYVAWRGRSKRSFRDHQRLADMHYYSLPEFRQLARAHGLQVRLDLHGMGRRMGPAIARDRWRRAAGDAAYRLGRSLSLGVACFELLLERNGRGGAGSSSTRPSHRSRPAFLLLLALLAAALVAGLSAGLSPALAAFAPESFLLGDLRPGVRVEVKGKMTEERFSASRVTLKADDGHALEIKAPVDAQPAPTADSLHLLGRPVVVLEDATVSGAANRAELIAALQPGRWIKIRCRDRDHLLVAESIALRTETAGSAEIEGPIDELKLRGGDRALIEIGGFSIEVDQDAELLIDAEEGTPYIPVAVDDDDARPRAVRLLDGRVQLGGQLRWDLDPETNMDLDRELSGDRTDGTFTGQLELAALIDPRLVGFMKIGLARTVGLTEPPGVDTDQTDGRLDEMYLKWALPLRGVAIQFGRQDFDEPREWLYDENLDAVRVHMRPHRRAKLELALAGRLGAEGIEGARSYAILIGQAALMHKSWAGAYIMGRNDPEGGDDARWFGLRAGGAPIRGFEPWFEWSLLRGQVGERGHRGVGHDAGATVQPFALLASSSSLAARRLAVTFGLARGSGGGDDEEDRTYRQTGFEDNTDRFAGVTSFKYYGELFDPELANIEILTMGVGARVAPSTSVDLVYHRYQQVVLDDRVRAEVSVDPVGDNAFLGSETDLIIGMEEIKHLEIELDLAAFFPGRAFPDGAATATKASLQFKLNF